MPDLSTELSRCGDLQSILDGTVARALAITQTGLGDLQLFDWPTRTLEMRAHHGFDEEFLRFFARVPCGEGTSCARAFSDGDTIVLDDVMADRDFAPFRNIACRSGFRACQSTPLVAGGGTPVGVLSTHFPACHRPTDLQLHGLRWLARTAADEIIQRQAVDGVAALVCRSDRVIAETRQMIEESRQTLRASDATLLRSEKALDEVQARISRSQEILRRVRRENT